MKHQKDRCIVLSRINYRDSDRILTVIGMHTGKQKILAKGIRKGTSKLAGSVELCSVSELDWIVRSGSDLGVLTGARMQAFYGEIVKDYDASIIIFDWMKLTDKLSDQGHGQEYYPVLETALKAVSGGKVGVITSDIWLRLQYLQISGYEINWDNIDALRASKQLFVFDFDSHQFIESELGMFDQGVLKLVRYYASDNSLRDSSSSEKQLLQASKLLSEITKKIV